MTVLAVVLAVALSSVAPSPLPPTSSLSGLDAAACTQPANDTPASFDAAIAACTRLIQNGSQQAEDLGTAYLGRGNAYAGKKDYTAAIADYAKAITLMPRDAAPYYNRGLALHAQNNCASAVVDYSQAILNKPDLEIAVFNRALCYEALKRTDDAIADYARYNALKPQEAAGFLNRGVLLYGAKRYDEAIADLDRAIALKASDPDSYVVRGNAKDDKGDHQGAITDYNKALSLTPQNGQIYFNRALAYQRLDRYDDAMRDYNKAIALAPDMAWAYGNRCNLRARTGKDLAAALEDCDRAVSLEPGDVVDLTARALVKFKLGNFKGVLSDTAGAISQDPTMAGAFYLRGLAKLRLNDNSGYADLQAAVRFNPNIAQDYSAFGVTQVAMQTVEMPVPPAQTPRNVPRAGRDTPMPSVSEYKRGTTTSGTSETQGVAQGSAGERVR